MQRLHLHRLTLRNFKNHASLDWDFVDGYNIITGRNGTGKTNVLDAIYILAFCKSAFQPIDKELGGKEGSYFSIDGFIETDSVSCEIGIKLREGGRKNVSFNGNIVPKLSRHVGTLPLVMITPQDIFLIIEGSEERRKLIDLTLGQCDPFYLATLSEYNRALEQRNKLLKRYHESGESPGAELEVWNHILAEKGTNIYEIRNQKLPEILEITSQLYSNFSNGQEQVDCKYYSQLHEHNMTELLQKNQDRDLILERTGSGIHKDDIHFLLHQNPFKRYGSQGQQKTLVFALKLAVYSFLYKTKKISPLLLLDDVFEKIDSSRYQNLLTYITKNIQGQIFITDTEPGRTEKLLDFGVKKTLFQSLD